MNDCCYLGRGKVYIIESYKLAQGWGNNYGWYWGGSSFDYYAGRFLGNASAFGIQIAYSPRSSINRSGITFESDCGVGSIEGASVQLNIDCQSFENLALALYGRQSETFTSEPPVVDLLYPPPAGDQLLNGSTFVFDFPLVDVTTLIVKRSDTLAVLTPEVDYTANQAQIIMLSALPADVGLLLSYSWLGSSFSKVDGFVMPEKEYTLTFVGDNMAQNNEKWIAVCHRVKFSPTNEFNLINEDFQQLNLTGILLRDHVKTGQGRSGYFELKKVIQ